MTDLSLHFVLFIVAGAIFILAPLTIGRLIRPRLPTPEKDAIYECGEPTIGSSYIQFDIRFYVVALLFIIFDVEMVFFFPWATVFGGASQLADSRLSEAARSNLSDKLLNLEPGTSTATTAISAPDALLISLTSFADILVFFAVLLVGFAYVWFRGDLDWVRAMTKQPNPETTQGTKQSILVSASDLELASPAVDSTSKVHRLEETSKRP
ncbi:NADH-quinone oxidoreductase subunit A [Planctomicrobium sp. SH668]|uniref:NADH-quinone oxidoreductase subunit A n=1 Tax=Planctomicrobium sp. SH668 TaxID=3448126 RepID=UPI003F5B2E11